jgi:hypothetical protein
MNSSMVIYEENMLVIIGISISVLHTICLLYLFYVVNVLCRKIKILDDLELRKKQNEEKVDLIKKNGGIVAKYVKECRRHCCGRVREYSMNGNCKVYVEFFDYKLPYTVDEINKDDPDNGWYSIDEVMIEEDVRDYYYLHLISKKEYMRYKDMLDCKNVLVLVKVETIYGETYYLIGKSKVQVKMYIKKLLESSGIYYRSIVPLDVMDVKLIDEAEENMVISFSFRFEDTFDVDNNVRMFVGEEEDMRDEFHMFLENHMEYKK